MNQITCLYFSVPSGRFPVEEFILSLQLRSRLKFFSAKEKLEIFGRKLPMPHAKYLRNKIFELRFPGSEGAIRVFYFFDGGRAILTNGFIKKTEKTPGSEIELAIRRQEEYFRTKSE